MRNEPLGQGERLVVALQGRLRVRGHHGLAELQLGVRRRRRRVREKRGGALEPPTGDGQLHSRHQVVVLQLQCDPRRLDGLVGTVEELVRALTGVDRLVVELQPRGAPGETTEELGVVGVRRDPA